MTTPQIYALALFIMTVVVAATADVQAQDVIVRLG